MRLSEFNRAVDEEFGHAYGRMLVRDLVLPELGSVTAEQALTAGRPAKDVWLALCEATDVPPQRRYGAGLPAPRQE